MNPFKLPGRRHLASTLLRGLLALLITLSPAAAIIDLTGDGLGAIWKLKYRTGNLPPAADSDGDGRTNSEEATAGTDPLAAGSAIAMTSVTMDATGVHLTWKAVAGKRYQVQSATSLSPQDWQDEGTLKTGIDGIMSQTCPGGGAERFYRATVRDADSDGDGVTDWEELQVGSNPNSTHSAGFAGGDDLTRLTAALQSPNTVSVSASDPGASEIGLEPGAFAFTRVGNLGSITVRYAVSGTAASGADYQALSGSVTLPMGVNSATVDVIPLADALRESPEPVIVTLLPDAAYTVGSSKVATVIIRDTTSATGSGLRGEFWNEVSSGTGRISDTNPAKFVGTAVVRRIDPTVNFTWPAGTVQGTNSPAAGVNTTYYASRWSGEVLPQYSQVYTFYFDINRAGRLWVNGQLLINNWPPNAISVREHSKTIELVGGVRYPIVIEEYATTSGGKAVLSWQSSNQPKQVIPAARLFADMPPQITSATEVTLLKNSGPFTYQIVASGQPTSYAAANLPEDWTINATGAITGSPTEAGVWEIPLTAINAAGSGSAVLTLTIVDTSGGITREMWNGSFATVGALPLGTVPNGTGVQSSLEVAQGANDSFGSRLRGFLFAPATGAYQFWVTGDDAAELWISNDDEPINLFQRAATTASTGFRAWTSAGSGKSSLLWLKAGQRYYVEVRHVESAGSDHVSVGWFKPGDAGDGSVPTEVVPGYALSPWAAPAPSPDGTLFTATLTPQGNALSGGSGTSSLRLSPDETSAMNGTKIRGI